MSMSNPVFEAHMLLLRWGEEELASQDQDTQRQSDEPVGSDKASTDQCVETSTAGLDSSTS